jgi:hypothetical protein
MDNREIEIDRKLKLIEKERHEFKQDKLCSLKIEKMILHIKNQYEMEQEDFRSLCHREQLKALNYVSEAQYLKAHYE